MRGSLLVLVVWAACAAVQPGVTSSGSIMSVGAAEPVELRVGATITAPGTPVLVTFDRVRDDSRCPKGVTCIWEGDAIVVLRLRTRADDEVTAEVHANPGFTREASAHGVTVTLESLEPQPEADQPVPAGAYVARLVLSAR